jgi:isopenicillin N synthase-like dioxygenase
MLLDEIPSLDLADFKSTDPKRKAKFVHELGNAFNTIGFVAIKGHGLSESFTQSLYQEVETFFKSPDEVKKPYEIPGISGQRGYVGKGKETAKGFKVPDLKEFYHVGQPFKEDGDAVWEEYPANVFPREYPEFEKCTVEAFQTLESAGKSLLQAIALYLNLPEDYFESRVNNGNSILRAIHYFPIENPDSLPEGAVRAAAHGDINLITLLMGASAEGLEVLRMDGKWIPITALPDQLVVNVGDMLDRLTNHKLKSTIHRVVNPPREDGDVTLFYSIFYASKVRNGFDLFRFLCFY